MGWGETGSAGLFYRGVILEVAHGTRSISRRIKLGFSRSSVRIWEGWGKLAANVLSRARGREDDGGCGGSDQAGLWASGAPF